MCPAAYRCLQTHTKCQTEHSPVPPREDLWSLPIEGGNPEVSLLLCLNGCCHSLRRAIEQTILQKPEKKNNAKKGLGHWILVFHMTPRLERQGTVIGTHMTSLWKCYKTIQWFLCQDQLNTEIFLIAKKKSTLFSSHPSLLKNMWFKKIPQTSSSSFFCSRGRTGDLDLGSVCWIVGFWGFLCPLPCKVNAFKKGQSATTRISEDHRGGACGCLHSFKTMWV